MSGTGHGSAMALMRKFYGLAMARPCVPKAMAEPLLFEIIAIGPSHVYNRPWLSHGSNAKKIWISHGSAMRVESHS